MFSILFYILLYCGL